MDDNQSVKLDASELLGLSQVAKVSEDAADSEALGRVLSKIGDEAGATAPRLAKLLSKIGEALESDVRLKRDIEQLANRCDGLPIYAFKYLWDDKVHVGVMAQDLLGNELWRPAVLTGTNGYLVVDYGSLGLRMTTLDDWRAKGMAALDLNN